MATHRVGGRKAPYLLAQRVEGGGSLTERGSRPVMRARMMDIEFVHITKDTTPEKLEEELLVKDLVWKLR